MRIKNGRTEHIRRPFLILKVEAYKAIGDIRVPIIVRLQGTNAEEGARIIDESGLKVSSAVLLKDAAARVKEVLANA